MLPYALNTKDNGFDQGHHSGQTKADSSYEKLRHALFKHCAAMQCAADSPNFLQSCQGAKASAITLTRGQGGGGGGVGGAQLCSGLGLFAHHMPLSLSTGGPRTNGLLLGIPAAVLQRPADSGVARQSRSVWKEGYGNNKTVSLKNFRQRVGPQRNSEHLTIENPPRGLPRSRDQEKITPHQMIQGTNAQSARKHVPFPIVNRDRDQQLGRAPA